MISTPAINNSAYYHLTAKKSLASIAKRGLLPATISGTDSGLGGDPNYIYLFHHSYIRGVINSLLDIDSHSFAILEVFPPHAISIERDYHTATGLLEKEKSRAEIIDFFRFLNVDFAGTLTRENIKKHVDMVKTKYWPGTYRTTEPIPAQHIYFERWDFINEAKQTG